MIYFCIRNAILIRELFTLGCTNREARNTQLGTRRGRRNPQRWGWGRERDSIQASCNTQRHRTADGELRDGSRPPPRQDGGQGREEGDAAWASGAAASAVWETPASFCGNPRLRYGCFNLPLVNPEKHLIQLHTPKCSWGITRIYNRESTSVERRSLNCSLTEL